MKQFDPFGQLTHTLRNRNRIDIFGYLPRTQNEQMFVFVLQQWSLCVLQMMTIYIHTNTKTLGNPPEQPLHLQHCQHHINITIQLRFTFMNTRVNMTAAAKREDLCTSSEPTNISNPGILHILTLDKIRVIPHCWEHQLNFDLSGCIYLTGTVQNNTEGWQVL